MMPLLQQTGNLSNASASFSSGFGSSTALVATFAVVAATLIVLLGSQHAYRWALRSASTFARSLEYAIKGVATAAVLAVFAAPLYALAQTTPGQRRLVAVALLAIAVGYVGLVVLGVIGDRAWELIVRRHEEATGHAPFENWGTEADTDD